MTESLPVKGRHLLMIATGRPGDTDEWPDLDVDAETTVWVDWLTDPALGDRAFALAFADLADSPSKARLNEVLEQRGCFDKHRDVVVCYITGHGEQHNREHRLVLRTSIPGEPSSMLQTRQVLEWLRDQVDTAMVVVDTCYSGDVAAYLASLDEDLPEGWIVISTASAHEQARLGVLTEAMREFASTGAADPAFPELQFGELYKALSTALHGQRWKLLSTPLPWTARPVCLPNSYYRPDVDDRVVAEPARQDVAMYEKDLAAHWDPRSRGVAEAAMSGFWFTGRDRLMDVLIEAARGGPGVLVLTGGPGCGKSAALSRLVTFSDPSFRVRYADAVEAAEASGAPLPDVGDVNLAVLAKGLVAQGVLDAIRDRLQIEKVQGESSAQTIARIHHRRSGLPPVTLVLDALDEAEDPRGILNTVLAPLVSPPDGVAWLRLLVGVRGGTPRNIPAEEDDGLAAATVRALGGKPVDAATELWSHPDLAGYVARLLRVPLDDARPTPYADADDDVLDRLAASVAGIAGTSYVLARLISDQLRRQPHRQDPDDGAWQARARAGMASVLDEELEADYPDPHKRARVRSLLTAASLARGRGVPRRHIWPALATSLHPAAEAFADADIGALLEQHVGGYLTRDVADNATVYRPFHDSLAEALTRPLDRGARHRVTTTLTDLFIVTEVHGLFAPPQEYLRRHLVEHATESGDLDELIRNPTVLAWADPNHLMPLLDQLQDAEAREIGRVYRATAHTLGHADGQPDTLPLQLRTRQAGLDALADRLAQQFPDTAGGPSFQLRWATPRRDSDHHRSETPSVANAVTTATLPDGTPVIVSGSDEGTVEVWRLGDGSPLGEPLHAHDGSVSSVAVGALPDGTPLIVSGSYDRTVRVWRLADGTPIGEPLRGHEGPVSSVAVGALPDGTPAIVSGSYDHTVRAWRLGDSAPVGKPLRGHDGPVSSVAVATLPDGTPAIVSGSDDGSLRVWRFGDAEAQPWFRWRSSIGEPLCSYYSDGMGGSVAVGRLTDRQVRGRFRRRRSSVGGSLGASYGLVSSVAAGALTDGTEVIASAVHGKVRVWRLADGAPVCPPLGDHDGMVTSVAVGALPDGTAIVVSGSDDRTVRVWRLPDGTPMGEPLRGHDQKVSCVAVGMGSEGTPVIISGGYDRTVRVWRLPDSAKVGEPARGHDGLVTSLAVGALPDGPSLAVSGSYDGTVRVWRMADGVPVGEPLRGHEGLATTVAVGALRDDTPVIISGSHNGTLRVWRLADGTSVSEPFRNHERGMDSLAAGALPDGTPVIVSAGGFSDRTARVCRLVDGAPIGEQLRGHDRSVSSVAVGTLPDATPVIVTGSYDQTVRVWRLADGTPIGEPLRGHEGLVRSVVAAALPDGTPVIISGSDDQTVRVWRLADGTPIGEPLRGHGRSVNSVAAAALPDGTPVIISGSDDQTVRVWRLADGTPVGHPLITLSAVRAVTAFGARVLVAVDSDLFAIDVQQP